MNLHLENGVFPFQTPSYVTFEALDQGGGSAFERDMATLAYVRKWAHETMDPPPLSGKDARNEYLIRKREEAIRLIDDRFDEVEEILRRRCPYVARQISFV